MSETTTLEPPETLRAPEPVSEISEEQAQAMVPITEEQIKSLNERVEEFINLVISLDVQSDGFKEQVDSIHSLGTKEIHQAASMSNRFLERPLNSMGENGIFSDKSPVSASLIDLRQTVERLDPSRHGNLLEPKKILGLIPYGNRLTEYFQQYQSSQSHLKDILKSLYNGQDELRKDNAAVELEKTRLWDIMGRMEQYIFLGKQIDAELEKKVLLIEAQAPEKARVVKEEILFYVRQKVQDLLTQLAVAIQGYLALDVIRKNNLELIKGVDRAATTTISALRTAVMVAQAVNNQKLVLDQVGAINKTTNNLIQGTARQLKEQGMAIHNQASSAMLDIEALNQSFEDIYASMEAISEYKHEALDNMKLTINQLGASVEKARVYADKVKAENASLSEASGGVLNLQ